MDTNFKADVDSLGHWSVDVIPGVRSVRISACEADRTAHMEIQLEQDNWANREQAIDAMLDIMVMFFDDLAITYGFVDTEEDATAARPRTLIYA